MKSLLDKLGIYDLLGYIIPGLLGVYSLKILYEDIFNLQLPFKLDDGFIESIIFLVLCYFIGIIMHEISQFLQEKLLKKIWGGMPSEKFLLKDNKICSDTEKEAYYRLAKEKFNIEVTEFSKEKSQYLFDRLRISLQQAGKDDRSQLFNAYYGMYRNLFSGTLICFIMYCVYLISNIVNYKLFNVKLTNLKSIIINLFVFLLFSIILERRTRRFGETYVKYVFRGGFEYYNSIIDNKVKEEKNENSFY